MKAAFLIRCSTDRQDYDRQIGDLMKCAKDFNYELPSPTLIFGEHITGKDDTTKGDRRSIRKLFKAIEDKEFHVLFVNEVSRMSRDSVSGRVYIRRLNNAGIPTYFRDKGRWTINPETKVVDLAFERELGTYFDGAADYLKSMKTQVASGRRARLRSNQMIHQVAFGYKKQGGTSKWTKNTVLVDDETAEMVRFVYDYYLKEGSTLKKTALAAEAKFNRSFSVGRVNHILNYKGYYSGFTTVTTKDPDTKQEETFRIEIPTIINEEQYNAVHLKLKGNRSSSESRTGQKIHLLSRLIKCPFCGHSFTPRKRGDNRQAFTWICMSRINNSDPNCKSSVMLNDDKLVCLIWDFLRKELLHLESYNSDQRNERINEETTKMEEARDEIRDLERQSERLKKQIENAYYGFIAMKNDVSKDLALEMFKKSVAELNKKKDDVEAMIHNLKEEIKFSMRAIKRLEGHDFSNDYLEKVENDFESKRSVVCKYIQAIVPYKIGYRVVVLEVLTTDNDIYYIMFDSNQKRNQVATYVRHAYAYFQNSERRCKTYEKGEYFYVPNASQLMDTESLEEFLSYDEMDKVCRDNNWTLDYSNYPNNINKNYVSNIERYNARKKSLLEELEELVP